MAIRVKRIYEPPEPSDGKRYLVDRLWPRGVSREDAELDGWLKELAPSDSLRKWFDHDAEKWTEFKKRYFDELSEARELWEPLAGESRRGPVTLLYGARDERHNQAVALAELLRRSSSHRRKK